MATAMNQQVVEEIAPTVRALSQHGLELVATEGAGMMFWADFKRESTTLRVVKDRGFWNIDCAGGAWSIPEVAERYDSRCT